jgi:CheY-like chemotaxis protein
MKKILVVEDELVLRQMYKIKFQNCGYEVEVAADGEEGLRKAQTFLPAIILLDIMMPKINGFALLERLKADPTTKNIPIVLLTNLSFSDDDRQKSLDLGAVSHLVKDQFTPKELITKVEEIYTTVTKK